MLKKRKFPPFNTLRLRTKIINILSIYFIFVLITQIMYGVLNFSDILEANRKSDMNNIKVYLNQAALNLKMDIDRVEEIASLLLNESYYYLEEKTLVSNIDNGERELNATIDLVFKTNKDIPGVTIYTQSGGMFSYCNPYSAYDFLSGSTSMYSDLLENIKDVSKTMLLRREYYNKTDNLLSVKYFKSQRDPNNYAIIVIEKNWERMEKYFNELGLLENGSLVLITDAGNVLFSMNKYISDIGMENIIKNDKFRGMFTGESGQFIVQENQRERYVFYDRSVYSGCSVFYIVDSSYLSGYKVSTISFIIITSIILILVNVLVIILFFKNVYSPIINAEKALREIVEGNTELNIKGVKENTELSPLYNDLNSLTIKLKDLINSEYASKIMKKQAEIDALQSQINPHFLYNTLESIRGKAIEEGAVSVPIMVKALADLFRYNISNKNTIVALEEELKNVENYLNIQQFRFKNKYKIIQEIQPEALKCRIPKLIVQPLVENAIKHGLETKKGKGTMSIRAQIVADRLIINVEDDGLGMSQDKLIYINNYLSNSVTILKTEDIRIGLGIININERIKLIYNIDYGLKIFSMKGVGTNVEVNIPINPDR
jgi:sensor histidine kinase YesM